MARRTRDPYDDEPRQHKAASRIWWAAGILGAIIVVIVVVVALTGSGGNDDSGDGSSSVSSFDADCREDYLAEIGDLGERWDDQAALAASTARIALSGVVGGLQDLRREAGSLNIPDCAQSVHSLALSAMDSTIAGMLTFMAGDTDSAGSDIESAGRFWDRWGDALADAE